MAAVSNFQSHFDLVLSSLTINIKIVELSHGFVSPKLQSFVISYV